MTFMRGRMIFRRSEIPWLAGKEFTCLEIPNSAGRNGFTPRLNELAAKKNEVLSGELNLRLDGMILPGIKMALPGVKRILPDVEMKQAGVNGLALIVKIRHFAQQHTL